MCGVLIYQILENNQEEACKKQTKLNDFPILHVRNNFHSGSYVQNNLADKYDIV